MVEKQCKYRQTWWLQTSGVDRVRDPQPRRIHSFILAWVSCLAHPWYLKLKETFYLHLSLLWNSLPIRPTCPEFPHTMALISSSIYVCVNSVSSASWQMKYDSETNVCSSSDPCHFNPFFSRQMTPAPSYTLQSWMSRWRQSINRFSCPWHRTLSITKSPLILPNWEDLVALAPSGFAPSSRQTTFASSVPQKSSQTGLPSYKIFPSKASAPPINVIDVLSLSSPKFKSLKN